MSTGFRELMDSRHQKHQRDKVQRRIQLSRPLQRSELAEDSAKHTTSCAAVFWSPIITPGSSRPKFSRLFLKSSRRSVQAFASSLAGRFRPSLLYMKFRVHSLSIIQTRNGWEDSWVKDGKVLGTVCRVINDVDSLTVNIINPRAHASFRNTELYENQDIVSWKRCYGCVKSREGWKARMRYTIQNAKIEESSSCTCRQQQVKVQCHMASKRSYYIL